MRMETELILTSKIIWRILFDFCQLCSVKEYKSKLTEQ